MNMLPGSTVPVMSRTVDDTLAFLSTCPESISPSIEVTPKGDVPATNAQMWKSWRLQIL
jgi:hypothetical protein